jgi:hypothetical protein
VALPVVPATGEAKMEGWLESKCSRPAWATEQGKKCAPLHMGRKGMLLCPHRKWFCNSLLSEGGHRNCEPNHWEKALCAKWCWYQAWRDSRIMTKPSLVFLLFYIYDLMDMCLMGVNSPSVRLKKIRKFKWVWVLTKPVTRVSTRPRR